MGMLNDINQRINPSTGAVKSTIEYNKGIKPAGSTIVPLATNNAFPTYNPNLSALQAQLSQMMQGFADQQTALKGTAQSSLGQTETAYQNLLTQIANQQKESRQDFGAGRATIAEDAFTRGRNLSNKLASRNLSASGLMQLGDVQNRMETGRQISGLSGQYFDTKEKLADSSVQGTQNYEAAKAQIQNSLAAQLANLTTAQAGAQMSGLATIEQLRQAGVSSAQNAAGISQAQTSNNNMLEYNNLAVAADKVTSYAQKAALIKANYAEAGQTVDGATINTLLNDQAKSQYQALVGVNGYEDTAAKQFKLEMLALGYPKTLFTISNQVTEAGLNSALDRAYSGTNWYDAFKK